MVNKLSISNIAWAKEYDNEIYQFISDNGFTGLEVAPTKIIEENPYDNLNLAKTFADEIKEKYNLDICSIQSILFGKTEKLFGSNEERQKLFDYTKKAIDFASAINCHNVVFGSPKNRIMENKEQYQIAVKFFNELGNYATQKNTTISIEANPIIYGTNFINTTEQAFQLVKELKNRGFMINIDFGTIIENNENIDLIIKNIELVNHIHISEPNLVLIKKRKLHQEFANKLKQTSYNKFVSIEMKNTNNINYIKSTIKYIKGVFDDN